MAPSTRATSVARIRIAASLTWVDRYLARARRRMPTMALPKVIRAFRPNPKKKHRTLGSCCRADASINIATHTVEVREIKGRKRRILRELTRLEILQTLAHELAHLAYERHDYEQEWYARTIFHTFGLTETCPHCEGKGKIPARYENT